MKAKNIKVKTPTSSLDPLRMNAEAFVGVSNVNKGEFYYLRTKDLIPFSKQARRYFSEDKILDLAATIKEHGIRQPLTVIRSEQDPSKYEIVSGERRCRAAISIELEKVPCIILTDRLRAEEIALIENIQREDLHPIELGASYLKLSSQKDIPLYRLAETLSVSKSSISECVGYARLEADLQNKLISNNIRERSVLRKIVNAKGYDAKAKILENEISKRTSNVGKSYGLRKKKIMVVDCVSEKIQVDTKGIRSLTKPQKDELIAQLENILVMLKKT